MFKAYLDQLSGKKDLLKSLEQFKSNPPILSTDTTGSNGKTSWDAVSDTFFNKTVTPYLLNVGLQLIALKNDTHAGVALVHTNTGQYLEMSSLTPIKQANMPLLGAMAEIGAVTYIQRMLSIKILGLAVHTREHISKGIDQIPNATQLNTPPPQAPTQQPQQSQGDLVKHLLGLLPQTKDEAKSLAFINTSLEAHEIDGLNNAPEKFLIKMIDMMEKAIKNRKVKDGN